MSGTGTADADRMAILQQREEHNQEPHGRLVIRPDVNLDVWRAGGAGVGVCCFTSFRVWVFEK
jgi:hypothetical protein